MGIQPIDLQTMYSQLSNISKTVAGAQQAQLTEAMQQQSKIQKGMEKASTVQETSNEQSIADKINQNGSGNDSFANSSRSKNNKKEENQEEDEMSDNKAGKGDLPYLGNLVDISG